jgi:hypothetical protein
MQAVGARALVLAFGLVAASGCGDEGSDGGSGAGGVGAASSGGTAAQLGGVGTAGIGGGAGTGGAGVAGGGTGGSGAAGTRGDAGSAAAAGNGGSGPAAEPTPDNLMPLAVGNRWTYRVTVSVPDTSPCAAGDRSTEILAASSVDGRDAFEAKHVCDAVSSAQVRFYAHTDAGLETRRCPDGAVGCVGSWTIGLPRPIVDGATFDSLVGLRTLRRLGRVSVEAGTFDECWETEDSADPPLLSVYCVGVGPVAFSQIDATAAMPAIGYELELTSYVVQ